MARRFNGTSDFIVFTLPSTLEAVTAGSTTIVFVANFTDAADGGMVHARTSGGTNSWWMESFTDWNYGQGTTPKNVGAITTGSWAAYIGRKTTGGANAPRGRKIIFGGATTDVTAGTGLADGTAPGSGGVLQVGKWGTASEFISADVAAVAVFSSDLSDATTATFTTWQAILDATPVWAVHFDQASATDAITDATGNGGNSSTITGTTIVANPSGFFAAGDATAAPSTVAAVAAVPTPTLSTGSVVALGGPVATVAAVPSPTPSTGSTIVLGAAVLTTGAVPAPALSTGSTVVLAGPVAAVAAVPTPDVAAVTMVQLQTVAATGTVPTPTVSVGSVVTLSAAVAGIATVPLPTVSTAAPATGLVGEAHGPLPLAVGAITVHTGSIAGAVT